ncbi:MAG: hypothetical protein ACRDSM_02105 [Pseudonocardiaceae bacterium]
MKAAKEVERSSILNKAITIFAEESVSEDAPTSCAITLFVHLKCQEGADGPYCGNINLKDALATFLDRTVQRRAVDVEGTTDLILGEQGYEW